MKFIAALVVALTITTCAVYAHESTTVHESNIDLRFNGPPARDADGRIARSMLQRALFVRMHPCPATGQVTGACQKWAVDHIIPLACGGVDAPVNMQWLPLEIKSCAKPYCKDRFERHIYQTTITC